MLRNLLTLRQIAQTTISTVSRRQFENKVPEKQKTKLVEQHMPLLASCGFFSQEARLTSVHLSRQLVQFHSALYGPVIDKLNIY
uniref:Uncharacterized protein n=1 Tax=Canis lupus familiaris TaxID=9615 RepID=A0A8I3MP95_CANLF